MKVGMIQNELKYLGFSEKQIIEFVKEAESVFVGKDDFSSSFESFLNFRIGEVKSKVGF